MADMAEHHEFLRRARHPDCELTNRELLIGTVLLLEVLMDQVQELKASLDGLVTSVNDAKTRVTAHVDALDTHVQELEASIAANPGTPPDLGPLKAEVEAARGTVESIDPTPPVPPPAEGSPAEEATETPEAEATEDAPPPPADPGTGTPPPAAPPA